MVFWPWNPCRTTDQLSAASLETPSSLYQVGQMSSASVDEPWFISELGGFSHGF